MIQFEKMCASGNDFIVLDQRLKAIKLSKNDIALLCDRRYGVGADQLLTLQTSTIADVKMNIYNNNGSKAKQCGNGLRAVAKLILQDQPRKTCFIEVEGIIHQAQLLQDNLISVTFPLPIMKTSIETSVNHQLFYSPLEVNTGNEHLVLWVNDINAIDAAYHGALIEQQYPNDINIHFVEKIDDQNIYIRHWERGAGVTLSCGSGSIASSYAGIQLKNLANTLTIHGIKEKLSILFTDENCILTANTQHIFSGQIRLNNI